jgi:hypothetical protein
MPEKIGARTKGKIARENYVKTKMENVIESQSKEKGAITQEKNTPGLVFLF